MSEEVSVALSLDHPASTLVQVETFSSEQITDVLNGRYEQSVIVFTAVGFFLKLCTY